ASLESGLRVQVRVEVVLGDEEQASGGLRRLRQSTGQLVQAQLHHREEALQIGLLVNREVKVAAFDQLQGRGQQVVAASVNTRGRKVVGLHDLGHALRAAGVDRERPLRAL